MRLTEPKLTTWGIAVLLFVLGVVATFVNIPGVSESSFWLVSAGFVVLALGTLLKGL